MLIDFSMAMVHTDWYFAPSSSIMTIQGTWNMRRREISVNYCNRTRLMFTDKVPMTFQQPVENLRPLFGLHQTCTSRTVRQTVATAIVVKMVKKFEKRIGLKKPQGTLSQTAGLEPARGDPN